MSDACREIEEQSRMFAMMARESVGMVMKDAAEMAAMSVEIGTLKRSLEEALDRLSVYSGTDATEIRERIKTRYAIDKDTIRALTAQHGKYLTTSRD